MGRFRETMLVTLWGIDNKVQRLEKDKDSRYEDEEEKKTIVEFVRDLGLDCGKLPRFTVKMSFNPILLENQWWLKENQWNNLSTIKTTGRV